MPAPGVTRLASVEGVHPLTAPLVLVVSFYRFIEALARRRGFNPDTPPSPAQGHRDAMTTVFEGAAVFDGARLHAVTLVEDGRVAAIVPADEAPAGARVRLGGGVLAPGFVTCR